MISRHLLPRARAWQVTTDKQLRQFFGGLDVLETDVVEFADGVYGDLFPATTRELDAWELQFGLRNYGLTEADRRTRLAAAWAALGGQSPRYIQDTLQAAGFDVYVHEWWIPGTEPANGVKAAATPQNPFLWLRRDYAGTISMVDCGEALAACGESFAAAGERLEPPGYLLVNKVTFTARVVIPQCGEPLAACGEDSASCGNYLTLGSFERQYEIPTDSERWKYFFYIGGETFGTLANVSPTRRNEFEALCLKLCPAQLWLGIIVKYVVEV